MHDLLLANQIIQEIQKIAKKKKIGKIKSVSLEVGSVALAHDNLSRHYDDINPKNLKLLLESIAVNKGFGKIIFEVKQVPSENWRILDIKT